MVIGIDMTNPARKLYWEEFYGVTGELCMFIFIPLAMWSLFKEPYEYEWASNMTVMIAAALFT